MRGPPPFSFFMTYLGKSRPRVMELSAGFFKVPGKKTAKGKIHVMVDGKPLCGVRYRVSTELVFTQLSLVTCKHCMDTDIVRAALARRNWFLDNVNTTMWVDSATGTDASTCTRCSNTTISGTPAVMSGTTYWNIPWASDTSN